MSNNLYQTLKKRTKRKPELKASIIKSSIYFLSVFGNIEPVHAESYSWHSTGTYSYRWTGIQSPIDWCTAFKTSGMFLDQDVLSVTYKYLDNQGAPSLSTDQSAFRCSVSTRQYIDPILVGLERFGDSCAIGTTIDPDTGECTAASILANKQKGMIDERFSNAPSVCKGNPINSSTGNKFQTELDLTLPEQFEFYRYYNSISGMWTHSLSMHLAIGENSVFLTQPNGYVATFELVNSKYAASNYDLGILSRQNSGWSYLSTSNNRFFFDNAGVLLSITDPAGKQTTILHQGSNLVATLPSSEILTITQDDAGQPLSLSYKDILIQYNYDSYKRILSTNYSYSNYKAIRTYFYENTQYPRNLTGITDERGIRYATWAYDGAGRAISSQHSNADIISLNYDSDDSTTVTNELNKPTIYAFSVINGIKRITTIKGQPSPNCPASNSTYTYNSTGQALTKTDAKGIVTQYTYNDRGLETQRIEGVGSAQPRTTTTEWDPSRFLRTKVAGPTHTTVYTYDAQGRQLTQITTPNPAN